MLTRILDLLDNLGHLVMSSISCENENRIIRGETACWSGKGAAVYRYLKNSVPGYEQMAQSAFLDIYSVVVKVGLNMIFLYPVCIKVNEKFHCR